MMMMIWFSCTISQFRQFLHQRSMLVTAKLCTLSPLSKCSVLFSNICFLHEFTSMPTDKAVIFPDAAVLGQRDVIDCMWLYPARAAERVLWAHGKGLETKCPKNNHTPEMEYQLQLNQIWSKRGRCCIIFHCTAILLFFFRSTHVFILLLMHNIDSLTIGYMYMVLEMLDIFWLKGFIIPIHIKQL